ncbi:oligopeptide ABC transporter substrate-binding protein [Bavariicoccus seileri]|uniref:oligopeptide ABC transporter substrate-binding protein n=1 Tax=Bavariicoccus seileri TaxID=549685 RepID=UPI0003B6682C|nr:oligopeptide ABC transporter substrate-binding protein [Bavariicoccus seileri]
MSELLKKSLPLFASVALLAACGNGGNNNDDSDKGSDDNDNTSSSTVEFEETLDRGGEAAEGGELKYALVSDSPITGIYNSALYQSTPDSEVLQFTAGDIFHVNDEIKFDNDGFAQFEVDEENNTVTVTFPEDQKWSDGEPITIDDYIFTHEFIADPDYPGIRYPTYVGDIEGADEFHSGDADSISGIEKVNDQQVILHYKALSPSIYIPGGQLLSMLLPKHVLEDIPMDEVEASDAVRGKTVDFGPYKIDSTVPGESVTLVANEYYWEGKPKIDKITVEVVSSSNVVSEMSSGKYDIAGMPADQYDTYKDSEDFDVLGTGSYSYNYLGFKLGKWDSEENKVVVDPDAKMANKSLRQAMAYAVDNDQIAEKFYAGTRSNANSLIPPVFAENDGKEGYTYDPKKAEELLDEAGYKDTDDDGIREDPNGDPLTINYATMAGGQNDETLALAYIQWWEKIGLKVELTTGRPIELNAFYEKVEADDPEIDVYAAAWGASTDPDPAGLYGENVPFNYTRFASDENTKLLKEISSKEAFDADYRQKAFEDWQAYARDEAFAVPTLFRTSITAVSKRVKSYSVKAEDALNGGHLWSNVELVGEE